jgi:hypothetical protein
MRPDPSIFKAYDIRGIVGRTIDEAFAERSAGRSAARPEPPARRRSSSAGMVVSPAPSSPGR